MYLCTYENPPRAICCIHLGYLDSYGPVFQVRQARADFLRRVGQRSKKQKMGSGFRVQGS